MEQKTKYLSDFISGLKKECKEKNIKIDYCKKTIYVIGEKKDIFIPEEIIIENFFSGFKNRDVSYNIQRFIKEIIFHN